MFVSSERTAWGSAAKWPAAGSRSAASLTPSSAALARTSSQNVAGKLNRRNVLPKGFSIFRIVKDVGNRSSDPRDVAPHNLPALADPVRVVFLEAGFHQVHAAGQPVEQALQRVRDRADEQSQRSQMGLELPDFGDVGAHLHHADDSPLGVPDGRSRHQHVQLFALKGRDHFFAGVGLAVFDRVLDRAGKARFSPVFVHLITVAPERRAEILSQGAVHLDHAKVGVLDRDITGDFLEQQPITLLALAQLLFQSRDARHVGRHFHDRRDLPAPVADRRGFDQHGNLPPVQACDPLLAVVALAVPEGLLDRADLALLRSPLIDLVAAAPLEVAEVLAEPLVGVEHAEIAVLNRKIARHVLEIVAVAVFHSTKFRISPYSSRSARGITSRGA